jgi:hypothetical protein
MSVLPSAAPPLHPPVRPPLTAGQKVLLALPLVPAAALLSSVYLPFVNKPQLWLGLPSLVVWCAVWVLLLTPTLLLVEYVVVAPREQASGEELGEREELTA